MRIVSILSSKGRKPRSATLRAGFAGAFRARRYRVQNASPRRKNRTMRRGSAHRNTRAASLCFRKSGDSCKVLKLVSRASQNLTFAKCCSSPKYARPAPPGQPLGSRGGRHCSHHRLSNHPPLTSLSATHKQCEQGGLTHLVSSCGTVLHALAYCAHASTLT